MIFGTIKKYWFTIASVAPKRAITPPTPEVQLNVKLCKLGPIMTDRIQY